MAKKKQKPPRSSFLRFPEVKGKVVEMIEIDPDAQAIVILFQDNTALAFDIETSHGIFPELSRRKSGNWTPLKHWNPIWSGVDIVKW